ncbi:aminopeptidase P family protein [Pararhizobium antarcticum]|uniref:X-Pro aminopeptidase n=1 Tax=Pararhizobium antarcticum TaxID=1798805 RepID=A0A657LMU8_9HYPH|nr:aminopeptidase P family protein [Pararhizobium antarcticum]OJF91465.1 X-Pro aminopeptidase [Pararhizobium antarcticum]OJG00362.1 X-Pro aminopeptidase [Rhizobium sp. 58]
MFQSFDVTSTPQFGRERTDALRVALQTLDVDGFLVPRADEFQGEYVPASAERLSWLTGFTGSAGIALVTRTQAIVFVDGRYVTQLAEQVDGTVFEGGDLIGAPPSTWLENNAPKGFLLGIDPWLHTGAEVRKLEKALACVSGTLVFLDYNPLDRIWADRPSAPLGRVKIQPLDHAGILARDKIARMSTDLEATGAAAVVLTDPSSIAWTFNIRGSDVPHTPHPLARAIIHADGRAELFLDKRKTGIEEEAYLTQLCDMAAPASFEDRIAAVSQGGAKLMIDPDHAPFALAQIIRASGGIVIEAIDPARLPRARKNPAELEGSERAHLQDGVAMVEFLAWLDETTPGTVTEIAAVEQLESCRLRVGERLQNPLKDISFDTISGAGAHAAIMHYRVTTDSDQAIEDGTMFLIDSGGQYINGTTDITRTVAIGNVPENQKRFFTLVLKGMIAISTARFPKGSRGVDLDPLARIALWKAGADFAHGTGHGVGSYLSVHEGPQRISRAAMQELLPGMSLSNEPGYYRPGAFGIRIENLVHVFEATPIDGGDLPMLGFTTLTFCPIDRRLILTALLTGEELDWMNAYHAETREKLMPLIEGDAVRKWLIAATEPLLR